MLHRPPLPTLFPYTTLFRSLLGQFALENALHLKPKQNLRKVAWPPRRRPSGGFASVDRKSTRLNSSHSQILYAVARIKKKLPYLHRLTTFHQSGTHLLIDCP